MPLLVVAIGQTFVLIIAGIDLSAPSILAMASVVGAAVVTQDAGGLLVGRRPLGHRAGGRPRLPRRRRADRRPERRLRDPLRHAGLHRHADDDDVLLRRRDLVRLGLHDLRQLDRQSAARASSSSARAVSSACRSRSWSRVPSPSSARSSSSARSTAAGCSRSASTRAPPRSRACRSARSCSGPTSSRARAPASPRSSTPAGSRPARRCMGQRMLLDVVGCGGDRRRQPVRRHAARSCWTVYGALFLTVVDKGLQLLGLSLASVFAIKGGVILMAADHRRPAPSAWSPAYDRAAAHRRGADQELLRRPGAARGRLRARSPARSWAWSARTARASRRR